MLIQNQHTAQIIEKACEIGFHAAGVVDLTQINPDFGRFYQQWLQNGYHGEMDYMKKNARQRFKPDMLVKDAKSAIVVLASYNHEKPKLQSRYKISRYALGYDYHFVVKQKLNELLEYIKTVFPQINGRAFTDSAPVPERFLAKKANLGFIGKNGMLINNKLGSFFFIGALYLDKQLSSGNTNNTASSNEKTKLDFIQCTDCDLCIRACPNSAIIEPGIVNSNKCISYKTIEYKGDLSEEDHLAGYIFGCDICQQVCPFNNNLKITGWPEFAPLKEITKLTEDDWNQIGSSQFKRLFGKTVLFRTGLKRIRRNISFNTKK
jgi:epoxyqueuosine reductase